MSLSHITKVCMLLKSKYKVSLSDTKKNTQKCDIWKPAIMFYDAS